MSLILRFAGLILMLGFIHQSIAEENSQNGFSEIIYKREIHCPDVMTLFSDKDDHLSKMELKSPMKDFPEFMSSRQSIGYRLIFGRAERFKFSRGRLSLNRGKVQSMTCYYRDPVWGRDNYYLQLNFSAGDFYYVKGYEQDDQSALTTTMYDCQNYVMGNVIPCSLSSSVLMLDNRLQIEAGTRPSGTVSIQGKGTSDCLAAVPEGKSQSLALEYRATPYQFRVYLAGQDITDHCLPERLHGRPLEFQHGVSPFVRLSGKVAADPGNNQIHCEVQCDSSTNANCWSEPPFSVFGSVASLYYSIAGIFKASKAIAFGNKNAGSP